MQTCVTYIHIARVTDASSSYEGDKMQNHPLTHHIFSYSEPLGLESIDS